MVLCSKQISFAKVSAVKLNLGYKLLSKMDVLLFTDRKYINSCCCFCNFTAYSVFHQFIFPGIQLQSERLRRGHLQGGVLVTEPPSLFRHGRPRQLRTVHCEYTIAIYASLNMVSLTSPTPVPLPDSDFLSFFQF